MTISEIIELGTVDVTNNSRCWFGDDCDNCEGCGCDEACGCDDPDNCDDPPTESPLDSICGDNECDDCGCDNDDTNCGCEDY